MRTLVGRTEKKGMGRNRLALRAHYWGSLIVVVARGQLDGETGWLLRDYVSKFRGKHSVIVDLWDVTGCDAAGVESLKSVQQLVEEGGWGFALVGDPSGPCATALAADVDARTLLNFADRRTAREALR